MAPVSSAATNETGALHDASGSMCLSGDVVGLGAGPGCSRNDVTRTNYRTETGKYVAVEASVTTIAQTYTANAADESL